MECTFDVKYSIQAFKREKMVVRFHYFHICSCRYNDALLTWQELDGICHKNNWILPVYGVSSLDGKVFVNSVSYYLLLLFF